MSSPPGLPRPPAAGAAAAAAEEAGLSFTDANMRIYNDHDKFAVTATVDANTNMSKTFKSPVKIGEGEYASDSVKTSDNKDPTQSSFNVTVKRGEKAMKVTIGPQQHTASVSPQTLPDHKGTAVLAPAKSLLGGPADYSFWFFSGWNFLPRIITPRIRKKLPALLEYIKTHQPKVGIPGAGSITITEVVVDPKDVEVNYAASSKIKPKQQQEEDQDTSATLNAVLGIKTMSIKATVTRLGKQPEKTTITLSDIVLWVQADVDIKDRSKSEVKQLQVQLGGANKAAAEVLGLLLEILAPEEAKNIEGMDLTAAAVVAGPFDAYGMAALINVTLNKQIIDLINNIIHQKPKGEAEAKGKGEGEGQGEGEDYVSDMVSAVQDFVREEQEQPQEEQEE